jgi:hypothetical protein
VLRARPKDVPLALRAVRQGSPARRALLDALGSAGGAEAQAALVEEMQDGAAPEELRREAAFALIRTPNPTEPSVNALVRGLRDALVHSYAAHGLGTFARRLRESGQLALAQRAADALGTELAKTKDSSARVEILRGIANSGDPRLFERVRPLADGEDESIRAAAVDAIRLMPHPDVDALVARHIAAEEKAGVRIEALEAVDLRGPNDTLASAVGAAALGAPDTQSRLKAVQVLGKWLPARPELRAVLERVVHADRNESVRQAARGALGS